MSASRVIAASMLSCFGATCLIAGALHTRMIDLPAPPAKAVARAQPSSGNPVIPAQPTDVAPDDQDSTYEQHMRERGQDAPEQPPPAAKLLTANSPFSVQFNLDLATAYFYHGIIQEDNGLILQPAARFTVNLFEEHDCRLDAFLGVWNSFHGQKTGARGGRNGSDFIDYWYESDLIAGFTLTKSEWTLTTAYTFLTSPSGAYETVQELDFILAYDDSAQLGAFALHPYALLGIETGADGSDGADFDRGTYLELGVAPGLSFDLGKTPVALSFPVSLGLSLDDYYQNAAGEDDTFGFAQVGMRASLPLGPASDRYGAWTLNAGVSGLFLGDHTADLNGGGDTEVIGTIGLQFNF